MNNDQQEDPLPSQNAVFIDNLTEDVWEFVSALDNSGARQAEIAENVALTERNFLGALAEHPHQLMYLCPGPVDPYFEDYVCELLDAKAPRVLPVSEHQGQVSLEVLMSPLLMNELPQEFKLQSYCASKQLYTLVDALRAKGKKVSLPEAPADTHVFQRTVGIFGSKGGLRKALAQIDLPHEMMMPPGAVYERFVEALSAAVHEAAAHKGVVIKTNKGHAGMGVALLDRLWVEKHIDNLSDSIREELLDDNGYWESFPVIVERFITPDKSVGGGIPNVEGLVHDNGVSMLYQCGCRVVNGVFAGVELGKGAFHDYRLAAVCEVLGNMYFERGYRGYFDVDCIAGLDGRLYIGESNVRRTGGTWAYHVAKRLLGPMFLQDRYVATQLVGLPKGPVAFTSLLKKLKPFLYSPLTKEGLVINSAALLNQGKFGYMVIGKTREKVTTLEKHLLSVLEYID